MGQTAEALMLEERFVRHLDAFADDWASFPLSRETRQAIELQQYLLSKEVIPLVVLVYGVFSSYKSFGNLRGAVAVKNS